MKNRKYIGSIVFLIFFDVFLFYSHVHVAIAEIGPIIHIDSMTHSFPDVFEGDSLSHDFTVINEGSSDLVIKDVTYQ
jgi:hypothetical protein